MTDNGTPVGDDWFEVAATDLNRVPTRLAEEDLSDAGCHLQQAIEKLLKGFLVAHGWRLRKIHDLEALLKDAIDYRADLARYEELCRGATAYYSLGRYPPLMAPPTVQRLETELQQVRALFDDLLPDHLKNLLAVPEEDGLDTQDPKRDSPPA